MRKGKRGVHREVLGGCRLDLAVTGAGARTERSTA